MPVELPEFCFLSEAIEWVALGRVPQAQWMLDKDTYEQIDYRFYWQEMPDNFDAAYEYPWYDLAEFEDLGIPVNEEYFPAAEACCGENVRKLPERISEYEGRKPSFIVDDDGSSFDPMQNLVAEMRIKMKKLEPLQDLVDAVEAQFTRFYEIAWAKIFQLLASQDIIAEAINFRQWDKLAEIDEYEKAGVFAPLKSENFKLGFDWSQNELAVNGEEYVAIRVRTSDILNNRGLLLNRGKKTEIERFGMFFQTSESSLPRMRRKRGRPFTVDWNLLAIYLDELAQGNRIPLSKENCIYELIAYAEREMGKTLSRTSVQRHLGKAMDNIYAQ